MTDRVHIRNGQIIRKYTGEKGKVLLEDGNIAMPVVLGYTNGNDKIVPYEVLTNDTSTGADVVRTDTGDIVAPDNTGVARIITIRDKTQAEIDVEIEKLKQRAVDALDQAYSRDKALATAIFQLVNDVRVLQGLQPVTVSQFKDYLKGLL